MSFKAKKLNIDLTLDLTEYIPEDEGGIVTTEKTDAESLNAWLDFAIAEGEKIVNLETERQKNTDSVSLVDVKNESRDSVIRQIDFFYNKGLEFYKKIPAVIANEILQYISSQISPAKKK
jgi:hypothetical protein